MKKISDRVYEFFELDSDDHNLEVEVYKKSNVKSKVDYSLYENYCITIPNNCSFVSFINVVFKSLFIRYISQKSSCFQVNVFNIISLSFLQGITIVTRFDNSIFFFKLKIIFTIF
jgi:hypothetical protein